jgi:hypothetical protein
MTAVPSSPAQTLERDAAVYVVSYIDVAPKAAATAARLLRERIAPENQFVIVAIWNDLKAYEAGRIEQ